MTSNLIAAIVKFGATIGFALWIVPALLSGIWPGFGRTRVGGWAMAVRRELHPFALPLVVARYLATVWLERAGNPYFNLDAVLGLVIGVWLWWNYRHEDDDRWTRRRRKVWARVKATASGRLVATSEEGAR